MMDGFRRPSRPQAPQQPQEVKLPPVAAPSSTITSSNQQTPVPPRVTQTPSRTTHRPLTLPRRSHWARWICVIIAVIFVSIIAAVIWYKHALTPISGSGEVQQVRIVKGSSFAYVSDRLERRGLIRSSFALQLYARLHHEDGLLKEGACNLRPNQSPIDMLHRLNEGCHDFRSVIFYPGATIEPSKNLRPGAKDFSVRASLENAGYTDADITKALSQTYYGPLFDGRPAKASLEGYVYGDTYYVSVNDGPEAVLQDAFNKMDQVITQEDIVAKFRSHGLSLYKGIILASIVQRELDCNGLEGAKLDTCYRNMQQIAQVFYRRLQLNMSLGSDATFVYAAGLTGEKVSTTIDSPYNTRVHQGLPPGPIASPGLLALRATANPAPTDYLYFVAGDEGKGATYFSKTQAEHDKNVRLHCQVLCRLP